MNNLICRILDVFRKKEVIDMLVMLWAQQIILEKKTFTQVPKLLKDKVREILSDAGAEELIQE